MAFKMPVSSKQICDFLEDTNYVGLVNLLQANISNQERSRIVCEIPESSVVHFIQFLRDNIPIKISSFPTHQLWLNELLLRHNMFLKTLPQVKLEALLTPLVEYNDSTVEDVYRVRQWIARLQAYYIEKKKRYCDSSTSNKNRFKPGQLFNREEESSSDEELGQASTAGASESEDNWDELSEMAQSSSDEEADAYKFLDLDRDNHIIEIEDDSDEPVESPNETSDEEQNKPKRRKDFGSKRPNKNGRTFSGSETDESEE